MRLQRFKSLPSYLWKSDSNYLGKPKWLQRVIIKHQKKYTNLVATGNKPSTFPL